jgi:anti-sigma factor NepR-like protein
MKNPKLAGPGARTRDVAVAAEPSLGRDIQTKIGQQLRAMYDDVVHQGVPARFVDLLDRLEKRDDKRS